MSLADEDYARLLALRTGLRQFERWSEQQAGAAGLTPAQHQLLLAIRGHGDPRGPTIGEVADYLLLRHHSTVELVDRADRAGLVSRARDDDDRRVVRLRLTGSGTERLERLSALHLEELERLELELPAAWQGLALEHRTHAVKKHGSPHGPVTVEVARVYGHVRRRGVRAILVDRLWPRGVAREGAPFDTWLKDVAPSTELRKWYGHVPDRYEEFAARYRRELDQEPARDAVAQLRALAATSGGVELVTATRDVDHSAAAVLRDTLVQS
jgi:uncharacterized protein YeaO (DUF488 family)/DNA-binding MarR family transcriptional regulator